MTRQAINFQEKFKLFKDLWSPRVVAQLNDSQFKLVRLEGEFVWHSHVDVDEAFIVIEGEMRIEFRDGHVKLQTGELFVVPKGVEHKPVANTECKVLLIEPVGTINTGNADGELTAENDIWI